MFAIILMLFVCCETFAQDEVLDPLDPFSSGSSISMNEDEDKEKSVEDLLLESRILLDDQRLLDARTKLIRAMKKDESDYRPYMYLSGYYLVYVGHFRLSLKYILKSMELFEKRTGKPPYFDPVSRSTHGHLLYLLSQIRLNLDEYPKALKVLDDFSSLGYTATWYAGSRAWVLMKLGRIKEATEVAHSGALTDNEAGRILNMLGILLSMQGERQKSLKIFQEAISWELSEGSQGQPATPLNNQGEVYEEIFDESNAERSYIKATRLPDSCEHILPSLNLALLYDDALNFPAAKRTLDNFDGCVAQFPLKNGEEHKALENMARGRYTMHSGRPDEAIVLFNNALQNRQWFGKIGTSEDDFIAGVLASLGQAYLRVNNQIRLRKNESMMDSLLGTVEIGKNTIRSWWYLRRARQVLIEKLENIEDMYIRNTDSMIEYPTFGEVLAGLPLITLERRLKHEESNDGRTQARPYYNLYLARALLKNGEKEKPFDLISNVVKSARSPYDNFMLTQALCLRMHYLDEYSEDYAKISEKVFSLSRAQLFNNGVKLVVNVSDPDLKKSLIGTGFLVNQKYNALHRISFEKSSEEIALTFEAEDGSEKLVKVTGGSIEKAINLLQTQVFQDDL